MRIEDTITNPVPSAMVRRLDSPGLALSRALADAGVPVNALEQDMSLPGVRSNRVRRVFQVQSFQSEHLSPALLASRQALASHAKIALLAINDRHVAKIGAYLHDLLPAYCIACAEKARHLVTLRNKIALQAVCEQQGLLYPRSVTFDEVQDHTRATDLRYPLILKPARARSSFKTLMAKDAQALRAHLEAGHHSLPILCQEYVPVDDRQIYFGALILDHGRVVGALAGRRLASHPPARGQTTISVTVEAPEVLRLTEQFFAGLARSGPVSLELKRDPTGWYWFIEPTAGRTDFWAELCISAGFNQHLAEFELAVGGDPQPPTKLLEAIWNDTERDPRAYFSQCWSQLRLQPAGRRKALPYFGHADAIRLARSVWRVTPGPRTALAPGWRASNGN